jgi:hypothetical protein
VNEVEASDTISKYLAAYNSFDIDGMIRLLSPEISFENYSGENKTTSTKGVGEFKQLAESSKALFSEREQQVISLNFSANLTLVQIAYRGRLAKDILDGPRAGTLIELTGTSEFTFQNGKISRIVDRS